LPLLFPSIPLTHIAPLKQPPHCIHELPPEAYTLAPLQWAPSFINTSILTATYFLSHSLSACV
jgi:hypothetical protein